ncbi:MAG: large-conductance mechanosensitive channel protein MscL [Bacteroidia bacterium]|nr:large-conductance mechanosensitive channel protein MscL [Bacteroidia bacterium]MDW8302794.1 large-conductance mechanosensitive channel protein MscL [Bacteroidia bacterium]
MSFLKSFIKEFKEFAIRGNVIDLAVGTIIGAAFGKIVTSVINDLIMPPIGLLVGGTRFNNLKIVLKRASKDPVTGMDNPEVAIMYGNFIQTAVDFTILAFIIFVMVKAINQLKRKKAEEAVVEPTPTEKLLAEIRDLLKNKS